MSTQAVGGQRAADASTPHRMTFGVHFHAPPTSAIAPPVPGKRLAHDPLPGRLERGRLGEVLPSVVGAGATRNL